RDTFHRVRGDGCLLRLALHERLALEARCAPGKALPGDKREEGGGQRVIGQACLVEHVADLAGFEPRKALEERIVCLADHVHPSSTDVAAMPSSPATATTSSTTDLPSTMPSARCFFSFRYSISPGIRISSVPGASSEAFMMRTYSSIRALKEGTS